VDGYLRMNEPQLNGRHFGPWYEDRDPGAVSDHLHIQGLKFHLDTGFELDLLWDAEELTDKVVAANEAGWQVAMHTFSVEAQEQALDALEAAIGPSGPNPLHHRIEHNFQVTDEQLARMVAMQIPVVIHLDTAPVDWNSDPEWLAAYTGDTAWFTRWKDFVDAGLPAAGATDMPWILPEFQLTDDIGRPVDQVAGGMDPIGKVYPETPPWMANQLLTAEQGLRTVTLDAAYALQDEGKRGHLAPGTWGDVTILSGDLLDASPDEIREFSVIATIVGGEVIYCSDPAICPAD
jgi:predicted amidohydrolase YtcJ